MPRTQGKYDERHEHDPNRCTPYRCPVDGYRIHYLYDFWTKRLRCLSELWEIISATAKMVRTGR